MEDQAARRRAGQVKPSEEEALALHAKYGSNEVIVKHCKAVARVALVLAEGVQSRGRKVDIEVVFAGAMLHDIGRSRVQTVQHGFEGSRILADEGVDEAVVQVVRRHVGAGISSEESKSLGLPDFDYIPESVEEMLVCFADKMVDADKVRPFEEEVRRFERKGHDVERLRALKKQVEAELGEDPEAFLFEKLKATA
jgi:uncharacterized protein (TIGR00295 family)